MIETTKTTTLREPICNYEDLAFFLLPYVKSKYYAAERRTHDYPGSPAYNEYWLEENIRVEFAIEEPISVDELTEIVAALTDCYYDHPDTGDRLRFSVDVTIETDAIVVSVTGVE